MLQLPTWVCLLPGALALLLPGHAGAGPPPAAGAQAPEEGPACVAGVCLPQACSPCAPEEGAQAEAEGPTVLEAVLQGEVRLQVRFSRAMASSTAPGQALHLASYCVERTDDSPRECTPPSAFALAAVRPLAADTVELVLSAPPPPGDYRLQVRDVHDAQGRPLRPPARAHFRAGPPPRPAPAGSGGAPQAAASP
jgi:hypothetical protein